MEIEIKEGKEGSIVDTRLKYQYLIDANRLSSPCPNKCKPINAFVYRFVDSETITNNDFRPNQIEDQEKGHVRKSSDDKSKCTRCAISLFDTAESAETRLAFLSGKQDSNFANKLIAIGEVTEDNGVASASNMYGHISYYEYINSNIYLTFEVFRRAL